MRYLGTVQEVGGVPISAWADKEGHLFLKVQDLLDFIMVDIRNYGEGGAIPRLKGMLEDLQPPTEERIDA